MASSKIKNIAERVIYETNAGEFDNIRDACTFYYNSYTKLADGKQKFGFSDGSYITLQLGTSKDET